MKYVIGLVLACVVSFFLGSTFSSGGKTELENLRLELETTEQELTKLKSEKSRAEECEVDLVELAKSFAALDLGEIKILRQSCSAERLLKFDAEFKPIADRISVLESENQKRAEVERLELEAEKKQREKENELREKKRAAKWRESTDTNRITDTRDVYLTLQSEPYSQKYGTHSATLTLRCQEKTTALTINIGEYVGDDSSSVYESWKNVTLRIDDRAPVVRRMSVATNNEAVGFWNGGTSIPFIKQMIGADRLVARITPYGENPREIVFPISGLEYFVDGLRENCGW